MLQIEVEGPVGIVGQVVAVSNDEAVERVGDLEPVDVVHGQRSERLDGWQLAAVEMEDVFAPSGERLAVGVGERVG